MGKEDYKKEYITHGNKIFEYAKIDNENFSKKAINKPLGPEQRFVFPYYMCSDGRRAYKFRGIFQLDIEETKKRKVRTWVRINDRLELDRFFLNLTNKEHAR